MPDEKHKSSDDTPELEAEPEVEATPEPEAAAEPEATPEPEAQVEEPEVEAAAEATPEPEAQAEEPVAAEPEPEPAEEAALPEPEATAEEPAVAEPEAEPAAEEAAPAAAAGEPAPAAEPEPKKKRKRVPRALRRTRTKPVRDRPAARKPITRTPKPESEPGRRQERRGVVVSDKGDKTIVVSVDVTKIHPKYKKVVRRSRKFHAHDEENSAGVGDTVRIVETRPLSKTKRWRLAEVVEKAK